MKNSYYNIFVVDDHPIIFEGLKQLLHKEKDLRIVNSSERGEDVIKKIEECNIDLIIIDINLGGNTNGIELTKLIRKKYTDLKILTLSMLDENLFAERAINAGSNGYVMKHEMTGKIIQAMRDILEGKTFLSENIANRILENIVFNFNNKSIDPIEALTDREFTILQFIGLGSGSKEIAKKLDISDKTVDTYKLRIKTKLHLKNKSELLKFAIDWLNFNKLNNSSDG